MGDSGSVSGMTLGAVRSALRSRRGASAAAALLLALAACSRAEPGRERLRIAAVRQPATALHFIAHDAGCFERERLDLDEQTFELGRDALALMRSNGADVAVAYETPTLSAALVDDRLRILTALHTSTANTRLVARRDRGIAAFSGLRGARIGLAQGSNADFFVELVLRFGGVPRRRVTIVDLAPEASVAALARGDLDAAVLSDPYAARAEQLLGDAARTLRTELYTEVSLVVTRDDVLRARAPALRRLLRGLACAERIARERPEEALRGVRRRFPELAEDELRRQVARVRWGLGLDHVLLGVLRDEDEWLHEARGAEAARREPGRLVARGLLEDVEPEAVMLLPSSRGGP